MIALPSPRHPAAMLAIAALGLASLRNLLQGAQFLICLPAVAVLGLPHGATDWWIASEKLPPRLGTSHRFIWIPVFGVFYLLASAAACGVILFSPAAALAGFIVVSAWHFGDTDAHALAVRARPAFGMALGLLPIAAPALFWPNQVSALVDALGVGVSADMVEIAGAFGVAIALTAPAWLHDANRASVWREQAALVLLATVAPPLLGFLVYFCGIHAPRQAARLAIRGSETAVWLVAATAAIMIAVVFFGPAAPAITLPHQAAQALFWGLAVLTLPHVLCGVLLGGGPAGPMHSTVTKVALS